MKVKLYPTILFIVTFIYGSLGYLKINIYHDYLAVLTIPIIGLFYVTEKKGKDLNVVYIVSLLLLLIADFMISIYENQVVSYILFGVGLLGYSYLVVSNICHLNSATIIKVSIPFLVLYLAPSIYFYEYFGDLETPILIHNSGLGFFVFSALIKLVHDNTIKANGYLLLSAIGMFLMVVLRAYVLFVSYNSFVNSFLIIPGFSLAHYAMAKYMITKKY